MRHHATLLADAVCAVGTWSSGVEDHAQLPLTARALRLALQLMLEVTRFLKFLTQSSVNKIRIAFSASMCIISSTSSGCVHIKLVAV